MTCVSGSSAEKVAKMQEFQREMAAIVDAIMVHNDMEEAKAYIQFVNMGLGDMVDAAAQHGLTAQQIRLGALNMGDHAPLGDQLVNHANWDAIATARRGSIDLENAPAGALFDRTKYPPESTRSGKMVDSAERPLQVTDIFPVMPTIQAAHKFMRETVNDRGAKFRAEGAKLGEAGLTFTEDSVVIESIGNYLPITEENLDDTPFIRSIVSQRLPFFVEQECDEQLILGNGTRQTFAGWTM